MEMKTHASACLLVLLFTLSHSCMGNTSHDTVVVYQDKRTEVQYTENDGNITISTPIAFSTLAFVGSVFKNKEFFAVISSALYVDTSHDSYHDAVARTSYGDRKKWTAAELFTNISKRSIHSFSGDVTAAMKGNKIYVLTTQNTEEVEYTFNFDVRRNVHNHLMTVGTVMNLAESDSENDVFVNWGPATRITITVPKTNQPIRGIHFVGGQGNGIVTDNGTIIFPIMLTQNGRRVGSTLYSIDDGLTWHVGGTMNSAITFGSVVERSDKKLFFSSSGSGYRNVFESDNMGITWKKSPVLDEVWGDNPTRQSDGNPGSAIAVPVDNKDVLLFTHPQHKKFGYALDTLQLWMSDGQRIFCVGTISDETYEENTAHSILAYVGGNLYVTHRINPSGFSSRQVDSGKAKWDHVIGLTPLPEFLKKAIQTIRKWNQLDEKYQSININTNGLIGLLGNTKYKDVWADMYNCVNATVTGGEIVSGGFRFDGVAGSGAKWPVESQGQNQLYKFTENAFTLTATITIHTTSEDGEFSLIGASESAGGSVVLIGLGYTKEKVWTVMQDNHKTITDIPVALEEEYHIVITWVNRVASVYVNGIDIAKKSITFHGSAYINHFFIGGTESSSQPQANGNSCTVKNVMLFSRAFEKSEIDELRKIKKITELNEEIIKEYERIEQEIKDAALRVKLQSELEGQGVMSNTKSTVLSEDHQSVSNTQLTRTGEKQKTNSNNKKVSTPKNTQTDLQNMVSTAPTSQGPLSTKKHNKETGVAQQSVTTAKDNDNQILNSLQQYGTDGVQTNIPGDNSGIVSLTAVFWMYLLCSIISMTA